MKLSLSTNWCNRRIESGEEIVEKALALGFDELELGFHTTDLQAKEIAAHHDRLPVGSIHAFCPVPISAPQGYPELYQLACLDEAARGLAAVHVRKNVEFAASVGADAVVLHAGRVPCRGFLRRRDMKRRIVRGRKLIDAFRRELDALLPVLERNRVTLGLENLPYLEGFPAEWELKDFVGEWVKAWVDTGHDFVRRANGWVSDDLPKPEDVLGLHLNDSMGGDDHLPPGEGKVDFSIFGPMARSARHLVFEPNESVVDEALAKSVAWVRELWSSHATVKQGETA